MRVPEMCPRCERLSYTTKGVPIIGTLFTMLPAGKQPNAIAVKAFKVP